MRVLVCGWRWLPPSWRGRLKGLLMEVTREARARGEEIAVVVGGCRGTDALAKEIAVKDLGWSVEEYPAEWGRQGKAAGPLRNARMLRDGKPDLVVALLHPDSKGTLDMVERARRAGVPVRIAHVPPRCRSLGRADSVSP